jgi:hypothetical protein
MSGNIRRSAETMQKLMDTSTQTLADLRQVIVNCSSPAVDRAGDIVVQAGISVANFMATGGTILWNHDPMRPIAYALECGVVGGKLRARAQFPKAGVSATADEVFGLIQERVINSASIGFSPEESEPVDPARPWDGRRFLKIELMEFSFVSVPCAPEAVIIARSTHSKSGRVLSGANAAHLAALQACHGKGEKCISQALDQIEKARAHYDSARRHGAAIAANARGDDDYDPDVDDADGGDPESDVELAYQAQVRRDQVENLERRRIVSDIQQRNAADIRAAEIRGLEHEHLPMTPETRRAALASLDRADVGELLPDIELRGGAYLTAWVRRQEVKRIRLQNGWGD